MEAKYTLDGDPIDLADFIAANTADDVEPLDPGDLHAIEMMIPGESLTLGGGAGAEFVLARVA